MRGGRDVNKLTLLDQDSGTNIVTCPFGAALVGAGFPDIGNKIANVVLGFDDVSGYDEGTSSQGATVGRYAGRIGNACFRPIRIIPKQKICLFLFGTLPMET